MTEPAEPTGVAIVGMACRLPGARDVRQFWRNLRGGVESISRFSVDELVAAGVDPALARHPRYVPARGIVDQGECFDRAFFGYTPNEAAYMDPQHRAFLETSSAALDDAGIDPQRFGGWIGVFGGCDMMNPDTQGSDADELARMISYEKDFLATRVAYKLGLRGPALTVQTACSTSLVAIHQAAQSLLGYECDAALAGGVSLWTPQKVGYLYEEGYVQSEDGHCRPFDERASGTVGSAGVGAIVLRRLADALRDGDRIVAVLRASAINNDGGEKIGYSTPSFAGQRDAIQLAHAVGGVDAGDIGYVEAHGTGTRVGDPIELSALTAAFRESTDRTGYCWLGAAKSNIGHTGQAAGVAGVIKTALMLRDRMLVPTLHYQRPNPELELESSPFRISTRSEHWEAEGPLLAGVSSFGIGGTNAHAILESAPEQSRRTRTPRPTVFCLSAATPKALRRMKSGLAEHLDEVTDADVDDVAWTLATGRRRLPYRHTVVATDRAELADALRVEAPATRASAGTSVAFLFPGTAALRGGFGGAAHRLLPVFRETFDELAADARARFGIDLATVLRPDVDPAWLLDMTNQMLSLYALGYSLARQFQEYGVEPAGMLGHSAGECLAATVSGLWTPADGLTLLHERGRILADTAPGRMLVVSRPPEEIQELLADRPEVSLAIDAPRYAVLAGESAAIEALVADGVSDRLLELAVPGHTPLMRAAAERLGHVIAATPTGVPRLPFVSNLTGDWAEPDRVTDAGYWVDHASRTVRLTSGAATLLRSGCQVFLELGPGQTMTRMLQGHPDWSSEHLAVPVHGRVEDTEEQGLLGALARLWERGVDTGIEDLLATTEPRRCELPAYPFERTRFEPRLRTSVPAGRQQFDAVLTLGDAPEPLVSALADDGARMTTADLSTVDDAIDAVTADGAVLPAVVVAVPAEPATGLADGLIRFAERAAATGVRLVLVGRGVTDDVGAPVLALVDRLRTAAPHLVSLLDLGTGPAPEEPPAATGVHVWRAGRWWAQEDRPGLAAPFAVEEPEPDDGTPDETVAPRDEVEDAVAAIWTELLGVATVGVYDNFFELGGHSLMATRLAARLRARFDTELPIETVLTNPTVADLASVLRGSTAPRRTALVAHADRGDEAGSLPVSFGQRRLWFVDHVDAASAYTIPVVLELTGALDTGALRSALTEIVRRHEALRTVFPAPDGEPVQLVLPPGPVDLSIVEQPDELWSVVRDEVLRPFDLAVGPLFRGVLYRLAADRHVLLLCMHHIISDGWSIDIISGELGTLYGAFLAGEESPLPEPAVRYRDYTSWQRQRTAETGEADLAYWTGRLSGAAPALELPTDRPRPPVQTYAGAVTTRLLPTALSERLRELSHEQGTTLFMTLLAAVNTLLHRYSTQQDISVGTPVAGRTEVELEELVGFFVNTLVLRSTVDRDMSFADLLAQARETTVGALAHQDVPFEKLVEVLNPPRDLSRNPLYQVVFNLLNIPDNDLRMPGLAVAQPDLGLCAAQVDLSFVVFESNGALDCHLEYNTDLFDEATAQRMLGHFETLLGAITAAPATRIGDLAVIDDAERELLLHGWNPDAAEPDRCLPQMFEDQVARGPHRLAVTFEGISLTYAQLNKRVNRLAHHLRSLGVGPESVVAVCLRRGIELPVTLLAILKSGGAYLPLDPDHPADRRAYMLANSSADTVVTTSDLVSLVDGEVEKVVTLDSGLPFGPERNPVPEAGLDHPAYIIYTSGSTGRPKGVHIVHRGLANQMRALAERPGCTEDDRTLAITTIGFDIHTVELYLPLITGGSVEIAPAHLTRDGALLRQEVERSRPTYLQATPATWRLLLAAGWPGDPELSVFVGGEALPRDLADALLARTRAVWNLYGPTETTVWATTTSVGPGPIHVGRPLANLHTYILDEDLEPTPLGVPGELFIGGIQLARGYHNQPGLTADRFVPHPHTDQPGRRLYRTGDRARYRPDGSIDYLGRLDNQVKVRGHRIELGEIESVLGEHETVAGVAVLVREDQPGDQRLVAYVVPEAGTEPAQGALREWAAQSLPDYMVPASIVVLAAFPLSPNGKVDRRALPVPPSESADTGGRPRSMREQVLCELFAETLGRELVGIDDSFFELGGHSLLAPRLIKRVRSVLDVELSVRTLFTADTPATLAERLGDDAGGGADLLLPLRTAGARPPLFCVHPISGLSWSYTGLLPYLADRPVYGLQARGLSEPDRQPADLAALAEDYLAAMKEVQPTGPYHLLGWSAGGNIAHELACRLQRAGESVEFLALLDSYPRLGASGPVAGDAEQVRREMVHVIAESLAISLDESDDGFLALVERSGLGEDLLRVLVDTAVNTRRVIQDATPGCYDGDILYLTATRDRWLAPESWLPHLTGTLRETPIDCRHWDMMRSGPLAEIGPLVDMGLQPPAPRHLRPAA